MATKTYVGIVRDHSGSMSSLTAGAKTDFNTLVDSLVEQEKTQDQEIFLTVGECGVGPRATYNILDRNVPIKEVKKITTYSATGGGTPLYDTVGALVEDIKNNITVKDSNDPTVAYLIMVITDGAENCSRNWNLKSIKTLINDLQLTDKWSFVFRVPVGYASHLKSLGIPEGNIMEWEQTNKGFENATVASTQAVTNYFATRSAGGTSTRSFYADMSKITTSDLKNTLVEVTTAVRTFSVPEDYDGKQIRDFCKDFNGSFQTGCAYYQLTKSETVQESKKFVIRSKNDGKFYSGASARSLLGLPNHGSIKLVPGHLAKFDVFVQSTSVNRKIQKNTDVLYIAS